MKITLILCALMLASCAFKGDLKTPSQVKIDKQKTAEKQQAKELKN